MKIGCAGFIVPFMFVYEPALLMIGDWPTIVQAFVTASCGVTAVRRRPARLLPDRRELLAARAADRRRPDADRSGLATDLIGA